MSRALAVRRCPLAKADFAAIGNGEGWFRWIREFEVRKVFEGCPTDSFPVGLELGCGTGEYSKYLADYCVELTATEYDRAKLTPRSEGKITYALADAQDLSQFPDNHFDLIYSSNVIEHLPHLDRCLSECRRTLKDHGMVVHTVPSRTWKAFKILLFYPRLAGLAWKRIRPRRQSAVVSAGGGSEPPADAPPARFSRDSGASYPWLLAIPLEGVSRLGREALAPGVRAESTGSRRNRKASVLLRLRL